VDFTTAPQNTKDEESYNGSKDEQLYSSDGSDSDYATKPKKQRAKKQRKRKKKKTKKQTLGKPKALSILEKSRRH
jgi:hypothetical protein